MKSQFGWHIIKLNEKRETTPPPLDQARPEIENQLRQAALEAKLVELRAAAKIETPGHRDAAGGDPRERPLTN